MEPRIRHTLERTVRSCAIGPYRPKSDAQVTTMLTGFFVVKGLKDVAISNVERMSSGASKEQFAFTLNHSAGSHPDRLVLRMDPLEAIAQTCRGRDGEIQRIMGYHMPVAPVRWFDADGDLLGQPAAIPEFVREVTRPSQGRAAGVSGMGGRLGNLIDRLAPQYIDALAKLTGSTGHARIRATSMRHAPPVTRRRSGRSTRGRRSGGIAWSSRCRWCACRTLAARTCSGVRPPMLVHSDLRMGNFMFEEPSGQFTTILDWELAHISDVHEDIAWTMPKLFGAWGDLPGIAELMT